MTQKELPFFFWLKQKAHVDSAVAQIFPDCEKQKKSHRDQGNRIIVVVIKKDIFKWSDFSYLSYAAQGTYIQLIQLIISKS